MNVKFIQYSKNLFPTTLHFMISLLKSVKGNPIKSSENEYSVPSNNKVLIYEYIWV